MGLRGSQEPILTSSTFGIFSLLNEEASIVLRVQPSREDTPNETVVALCFLPQISLGLFGKGTERKGVP